VAVTTPLVVSLVVTNGKKITSPNVKTSCLHEKNDVFFSFITTSFNQFDIFYRNSVSQAHLKPLLFSTYPKPFVDI
jgi:hypothetical protein